MHATMIGVVNFKEEFASMKGTLEMLSKESEEKDAHIKCQEEHIAEEHIAKLLKKLDKKGSNRSKASEDDERPKKGGKPQNDSSLSAMAAE